MPRCKDTETLRVASRRVRSDPCHAGELVSRLEAYLQVRCNDEGPAGGQGGRRRWAFFSIPLDDFSQKEGLEWQIKLKYER